MKMHYVILAIFSIIVVLCVVTLAGCANKTTLNKSQNLTCLGFCTSTKVEHDSEKGGAQ